MLNIEIKVLCPDRGRFQIAAEQLARVGAEYAGRLEQVDTYFRTSHGRLKLREWRHTRNGEFADLAGDSLSIRVAAETCEEDNAGSALIAYFRPDDAGSRYSDFSLVPLGDGTAIRNALGGTLGIEVVVKKTRELFLYRSTRIHLDHVDELGTFIELETVLPEGSISMDVQTAAQQEHDEVIQLLGLHEFDSIAGSYSDLLPRTQKRD